MVDVVELSNKYIELFRKFEAKRPDPDFQTGGLFYDEEEEEILAFVKLLANKAKKHDDLSEENAAHRTLGFIQGLLFAIGEFSLSELRDHLNNPESISIPEEDDDEDRFE